MYSLLNTKFSFFLYISFLFTKLFIIRIKHFISRYNKLSSENYLLFWNNIFFDKLKGLIANKYIEGCFNFNNKFGK